MLIKTRVPGFDKLLKGGLRENSSIIIKGGPGTGKTILALNLLVEGAKNGEKGLLITTEDLDATREFAKNVGIDLQKYEKEKKIFLMKQTISLKKLVSVTTPLDIIEKYKVKIVVLDSLTIFKFATMENELDYRRQIFDLINTTKDSLLIAISEEDFTSLDANNYEPEDYLFDGVIRLLKIRKNNNFERAIQVVKMRGQDHMIDIHPIQIKNGGIYIYPDQIPFALIEKGKK
ncbi:MAG: ATPase domain-containing protein [Nanoarchaeota archaeon]